MRKLFFTFLSPCACDVVAGPQFQDRANGPILRRKQSDSDLRLSGRPLICRHGPLQEQQKTTRPDCRLEIASSQSANVEKDRAMLSFRPNSRPQSGDERSRSSPKYLNCIWTRAKVEPHQSVGSISSGDQRQYDRDIRKGQPVCTG